MPAPCSSAPPAGAICFSDLGAKQLQSGMKADLLDALHGSSRLVNNCVQRGKSTVKAGQQLSDISATPTVVSNNRSDKDVSRRALSSGRAAQFASTCQVQGLHYLSAAQRRYMCLLSQTGCASVKMPART